MGNEQKVLPKQVSPSELQTYIMVIQAKLTQGRNKKVLEISKKRKELVDVLKNQGLGMAEAKMETIMQDEDLITVFDILGTLFERIKDKSNYILHSSRCPEDLRATLDTIIFASCRLEMDEIHQFREMLRLKFGDLYIEDASSNRSQLVNINVVEKLHMKVPSKNVIIIRIKQICSEMGVEYNFPGDIPLNQFHINDNQTKKEEFSQNQPFQSFPFISPIKQNINSSFLAGNNPPLIEFDNSKISQSINISSQSDPAQLNINNTMPNLSANYPDSFNITSNLPSSKTLCQSGQMDPNVKYPETSNQVGPDDGWPKTPQ